MSGVIHKLWIRFRRQCEFDLIVTAWACWFLFTLWLLSHIYSDFLLWRALLGFFLNIYPGLVLGFGLLWLLNNIDSDLVLRLWVLRNINSDLLLRRLLVRTCRWRFSRLNCDIRLFFLACGAGWPIRLHVNIDDLWWLNLRQRG